MVRRKIGNSARTAATSGVLQGVPVGAEPVVVAIEPVLTAGAPQPRRRRRRNAS